VNLAVYNSRVLTITMGKTEEAAPNAIKIQVL